MNSENMRCVSISTVYEDNDRAIFVVTSLMINPTSKQIPPKYHFYRKNFGKEFVIQNIEYDNQNEDILTKGLHSELFFSKGQFLCCW